MCSVACRLVGVAGCRAVWACGAALGWAAISSGVAADRWSAGLSGALVLGSSVVGIGLARSWSLGVGAHAGPGCCRGLCWAGLAYAPQCDGVSISDACVNATESMLSSTSTQRMPGMPAINRNSSALNR